MRLQRKPTYALPAILLLGLLAPSAAVVSTGHAAEVDRNTERARELFRQVYEDVERGDWSAVTELPADDRQHLEDYLLWPDLKAAQLRAELRARPAGAARQATEQAVERFLTDYDTLRLARELRYRYALHLAESGQPKRYLNVYQSYYQGRDIARLDCLALDAEIATSRSTRIAGRALALWLTGQSQADECDPVFSWLREQGLLNDEHYRQRFELAIEAQAFSRARWLGKSIDPEHVATAEAWQRAADHPETYLRNFRKARASSEERAMLVYAVKRLTYRDPQLARTLWAPMSERYPFSATERGETDRHVALWTARDGLDGAHWLLSRLPKAFRDTEVHRWRARVSLRDGEWQQLLDDLDAMPPAEAEREEWRYWYATARINAGDAERGRSELERLAGERSYYGFLAADVLGSQYALTEMPLEADPELIAEIAARTSIQRARELFLVGQDSRGRSEWDAAVRGFDAVAKQQAALLAHRWGWHSRAIATAASAELYDDLTLRYPLPFAEHFSRGAEAASIPADWAYGIARSESLFMRDVRSSAGAIGLMQLMPRTGREVARQLNIRYEGLTTLTDPITNIRLGTSYLGQMLERFDGNRAFATAAYNAGPHRVDDWRERRSAADPLVWIENIPFNETRKYVRRVLAAETIFHWRMTGETRRLTASLAPASAPRNETLARLGGSVDEHHLER